LKNQQLERENTALKKKLAQAEAIIDLQKKVSELLSRHVLEPETNGEKS
jgi:cell shape-determining protein MreC